MSNSKAVYELKRFKSSNDLDFVKALRIYTQNTDPSIRTSSSEITFWIDRYNKRFNDKLYSLGFYINNVISGYAQFVYFKEEKIVTVDYLTIDKPFRGNNTFYEFVDQIQKFLHEQDIEIDFIITEIGYFSPGAEPMDTSKTLVRLLKLTQFHVIRANYYHPMLGLKHYESEMQAILMMFTYNETKQIKKDTFLMFISTLYFKHYKRWYDSILDEKSRYEYDKILSRLFDKVEKEVENKKYIDVNGYKQHGNQNMSLAISAGKKKTNSLLLLTSIFIFYVMILVAICWVLKTKFNIAVNELISVMVIAVISFVILASLIFERVSHFMGSILVKVLRKKLD